METKLSTKGEVVLPSLILRKLGLRPGDLLEAKVEGRRVTLTPRKRRPGKARIVVEGPCPVRAAEFHR